MSNKRRGSFSKQLFIVGVVIILISLLSGFSFYQGDVPPDPPENLILNLKYKLDGSEEYAIGKTAEVYVLLAKNINEGKVVDHQSCIVDETRECQVRLYSPNEDLTKEYKTRVIAIKFPAGEETDEKTIGVGYVDWDPQGITFEEYEQISCQFLLISNEYLNYVTAQNYRSGEYENNCFGTQYEPHPDDWVIEDGFLNDEVSQRPIFTSTPTSAPSATSIPSATQTLAVGDTSKEIAEAQHAYLSVGLLAILTIILAAGIMAFSYSLAYRLQKTKREKHHDS